MNTVCYWIWIWCICGQKLFYILHLGRGMQLKQKTTLDTVLEDIHIHLSYLIVQYRSVNQPLQTVGHSGKCKAYCKPIWSSVTQWCNLVTSSSSPPPQGLGLLACSSSKFTTWNLSIYWTVGRTPWIGEWPNARPLPTYGTTQHRKMWTHIHAWSGNQTHDSSIQATKDSTCLRPLSQWDQLI
jgi:hypothetical protein